jgi:hypothetical protein
MIFWEELGHSVGSYVGAVYGGYLFNFLLPLFALAICLWLALRFIPPLEEPDYRRPLIAIAAAQAAFNIVVGLIFFEPASLLFVFPFVGIQVVGIIWLILQPRRKLPLILIGFVEVFAGVNLASSLFMVIDGYGKAAALGSLVLVLGALLWIAVGLRYNRGEREVEPSVRR